MFKEGPGGHSKKVSGRTRGSYVLLLAMERSMRLTVGTLGTFDFPLGSYLYFGSAVGGIEARVRRHLSGNGKHHWHIDFLADEAPVVDVWSAAGPGRLECIWARTAMALPETTIPAAGFGSSDCSCPSHLFHLPGLLSLELFQAGVGGPGPLLERVLPQDWGAISAPWQKNRPPSAPSGPHIPPKSGRGRL